MQESNRQRIINKIANSISLQGKFQKNEVMAVWTYYALEVFIFQFCLIISIVQPKLKISTIFAKTPEIQISLIAIRFIIAGLYLFTRSTYIMPIIKFMQSLSIFFILTGTWFTMTPLIIQFVAQILLTVRKQKRRLNFDSRLQNKFFGVKVITIYAALLITFYTPNNQIDQNPATIFFCTVVYYVCACNDMIYSYRTKQTLRKFAVGPLLISIYFICLPLVPVISDFSLGVHCLLSTTVFMMFICSALIVRYSYKHEMLFQKILHLQSRDKLEYLWSLIYFSQNADHENLICFVKNHQEKCFNALCPLNIRKSIQDFESLKKFLGIYLRKSLQRSASESDEMRRLFIYYRKQDDPKIIHLLKETDIYEKIQAVRIKRNLQKYNDLSLDFDQMKDIQTETFAKVQLYLTYYDNFLTQISKQYIDMQVHQCIISQLLKLRTFFLSFKSKNLTIQEKQKQIGNQAKIKPKDKNQIEQGTIPVEKMTLKTSLLVNFMRRAYFNQPSLQKYFFQETKQILVNEDMQQQPIIVLSAQGYNLGKVINWNRTAQKKLSFTIEDMRQKFVNDFLPKSMHLAHEKIFMRSSVEMEFQTLTKSINTSVFCFSKNRYVQIFQLNIQAENSISGNRWIVLMKMQYQNQACIVIDQNDVVVGFNKNAPNFGFNQDIYGHIINPQLHMRLFQSEPQSKIYLQKHYSPVNRLNLNCATNWLLISSTPKYPEMPVFYIFLIESADDVKQKLLQYNISNEIYDYTPESVSGFSFSFDPYSLMYTNFDVLLPNSSKEIQQHWAENDENTKQFFKKNAKTDKTDKKKINYGDNIHEMIYFQSKLEFKENYEVVTEFETHPNFLQSKLRTLNSSSLNINKANFMENITKIKLKNPRFIYQLVIMIIIIATLFISDCTVKFVQFNSLYSQIKQKELIFVHLTDRKITIQDIGSLAIYNSAKQIYPNAWNLYLKNNWTYQELFVKIQSLNAEISNLNEQIGALSTKGYQLNNQTKTLASYFSNLSISASSQSVSPINISSFVRLIVNDISTIESLIFNDALSYYKNKKTSYHDKIFIMDIVVSGLVLIILVIFHVIIKHLHKERCQIFRSLTVIQEEQINKIRENVREHQQKIIDNELDLINDDDYTDKIQSHNIFHAKAFYAYYFRRKIAVLYIIGFLLLLVSASLFLVSYCLQQNTTIIQQIEPFNKVFGEQRYSMEKLYLSMMAQLKTANDLLKDCGENINSFQSYKKQSINSIISNSLSNSYVSFFKSLWYNPCQTLNVTNICSSLFSGIISNNLDYNYIFIISLSKNIINYKTFQKNPTINTSVQITNELDKGIKDSLQKVNFLLFYFMVQLQNLSDQKFGQEIEILYNSFSQQNLIIYFIILFVTAIIIAVLSILVYGLRNLVKETLDMIMIAIPYAILMRNCFFVDWYKQKFKEIY